MHLSMAWIGALGSAVKVGFRTPLAILPLIRGGGVQNWRFSADPILSHLQSPSPSTFHHTSSTQRHPGPSLSPFLVSTCHLLPGVLPLILQIILPPPSGPPPCGFPHHLLMALRFVILCHSPLLSVHMAPLHLTSTCMVVSTPYPLVPRVLSIPHGTSHQVLQHHHPSTTSNHVPQSSHWPPRLIH
jgi:hypothetical protein